MHNSFAVYKSAQQLHNCCAPISLRIQWIIRQVMKWESCPNTGASPNAGNINNNKKCIKRIIRHVIKWTLGLSMGASPSIENRNKNRIRCQAQAWEPVLNKPLIRGVNPQRKPSRASSKSNAVNEQSYLWARSRLARLSSTQTRFSY